MGADDGDGEGGNAVASPDNIGAPLAPRADAGTDAAGGYVATGPDRRDTQTTNAHVLPEQYGTEKKTRSTLSRLTRRSRSRSYPRKFPTKEQHVGAIVMSKSSSSSQMIAPQAKLPTRAVRPFPRTFPREDDGGPLRVPEFITRCDDDDVSRTSTLTEPDVVRRARTVRATSMPSQMFNTIAEGFSTTGASSVVGGSGGSVTEAVEQFCGSFQSNLDNAYALFDNVLQYLPCTGRIKDAVELELDVDEKFSLDFQTVSLFVDFCLRPEMHHALFGLTLVVPLHTLLIFQLLASSTLTLTRMTGLA